MDKRIIRFTASWCQPCKMLAKTLEEIQTDIPIQVVDIDEDQQTAIDFGIRSVPTLVMLDGNTEMKRMIGANKKVTIEEWLNND